MEQVKNNDNAQSVESDKILREINSIRGRQLSNTINRIKQFELTSEKTKIDVSSQDRDNKQLYDEQQQAMGEIWMERDEQFRNEMDELEP